MRRYLLSATAAWAAAMVCGQTGMSAPPQDAARAEESEVVLWVQEYPGYTTVEYAFHVTHYPRLVVLSDGTVFATERPRDWMTGQHVMYRGQLGADQMESLAATVGDLLPQPRIGGPMIADAPTTTVIARTQDGVEQVTIITLGSPSYQILELDEMQPRERQRVTHSLLFELLVADLGRRATERYVPETLSLFVHHVGPQVPEQMELPDWPIDEIDLAALAAQVDPQRGWFGSPFAIDDEEAVTAILEQAPSGRGYRFADGDTYQVFWHPELPVEMPDVPRRP